MLSRLIYASQSVRPMSESDLIALLKEARKNNEILGLTGLLLYSNQSFLQVLEGEVEKIDGLYTRIEKDQRHRALRLLMRAPIDSRKFEGWSMGFEHVDEEDLADALPGFQPATQYPLVNAGLIKNGVVAETLLSLYKRNANG